MINVVDILSTVGVFSTAVGDIMSTMRGYLEYREGYSVPWGYHDACGEYHEYHGGVQYRRGSNLLLFEYPTVLKTPTVLMILPHVSWQPPQC